MAKKDGGKLELRYQPSCGETISEAAQAAIQEARRYGQPVKMVFNDISLEITGNCLVRDINREYHAKFDRRAEEYANSPAGRAAAEARRLRIERDQVSIDSLVASLPKALKGGHSATVKWVGEFAAINDNMNLRFDKKAIAGTLKSAGYKGNDCIQHPSIRTDNSVFARYLVGQAIDNLESGMPIHPIASKFAADYEELFGRSRQVSSTRKAGPAHRP